VGDEVEVEEDVESDVESDGARFSAGAAAAAGAATDGVEPDISLHRRSRWCSPPAGAPNHEVHVTPEQLPVHQCSVKTAGEGKTNLGVLRYLCLSYILR
jgi:hypothetical protein